MAAAKSTCSKLALSALHELQPPKVSQSQNCTPKHRGLGRADSAWYPSLRFFRMARPRDWDAMALAAALADWAESGPPIRPRAAAARAHGGRAIRAA